MRERVQNIDLLQSDLDKIEIKQIDERSWASKNNLFRRIDWRNLSDLDAIGDIQNVVWKFGDKNVVPPNILAIVEETGGDLLEAFDLSGKPEAFVLTLATFDPQKNFLHMVGVDPNKQSKNVGQEIMLLEGALARSRGVNVIEWTYDPLMGGNSKLYMTKLHATPYKYTINKYGVIKNEDTKGESRYKDVPTDRFTVKWNIGNEKMWSSAAARKVFTLPESPDFWDGNGKAPDVFKVGIPYDFSVLSSEGMLEARQTLRRICVKVMDYDDFSNRDFHIGTHVPLEFTPDKNGKLNTYTFVRKS